MSKEFRRPTRTTGMDENKCNALNKLKEARLKGISRVQQEKDVSKTFFNKLILRDWKI